MTGWNLPPGCNVCDIPGNRDIDVAYDEWMGNGKESEVCYECGEVMQCHLLRGGHQDECEFVNQAFEDYYYNQPDMPEGDE